ncbi:MAG: thioredoxin family protein [SAR202 cluster bacterium]|jgi:hypothetical protein|nr:thioredoxin family protein [SAR202 cluster bacterium]
MIDGESFYPDRFPEARQMERRVMGLGKPWIVATLLTPVALLIISACGDGPVDSPLEPVDTPETTATPPLAPQTIIDDSAPPLQMLMASSDFGIGINRLGFALLNTESGPIRDVEVRVSTFFLAPTGQEGPKETVGTVFRRWPVGAGGVYTAQLTFDRAGTWGIGAVVSVAGSPSRPASTRVQVKETSATPALGSPAPRSVSKTVRDVATLDEMTTDPDPDPDMYAMTIAEAIEAGEPLVVTFSTPAYCATGTCGPQLSVVKDLKDRYSDEVNFIHVEVYDNPLEIQGDLSRGRLSPVLREWNLPSEPWTFIVDEDGLIRAKFEAFVNGQELEEALAGVLKQ